MTLRDVAQAVRRAYAARMTRMLPPADASPLTDEERELLALVRAREKPWVQLQVTRRASGWTVATTHLDGSASSVGRGATFAEAWRRQDPRER